MIDPQQLQEAAEADAARRAVMQPLMCVCFGLASSCRVAVAGDGAGQKRILLHIEHATGTCVHDFGEVEARAIRDQLSEAIGGIVVPQPGATGGM